MTSTSHQVLRVTVGESLRDAGARATATMRAISRGEKMQPHFGVNFEQMGQMLAAFTPKRWQLITALREAGPLTISTCGSPAMLWRTVARWSPTTPENLSGWRV